MRHLHTLPASTAAVLLAVLLLAGPVAAEQSADTSAQTSEPAPDYSAEDADGLTTGSIMTPAERRKKQIEDCMAIWEPATHMTKKQWRRTCNNQLDEAPNL